MHCSGETHSQFCIKHLAKEFFFKKKKIIPKFPKNKQKILPRETSKPENMLKMTHVRSKKQMSKKNKRPLGSGRYYSQSNLLETFVSNRYSNFFSRKTAKKPSEHGWLFLHSMSLKHALLRYKTFTLLHQTLSKRILKKKLSRNSPKNKEKIVPEETFKRENS